MIILDIDMCKIDSPLTCKIEHHSFYSEQENLTPQQCMQQSMPFMAKLMEEKKGWRITKFKCYPENQKRIKS